jgi:hypothetical protein
VRELSLHRVDARTRLFDSCETWSFRSSRGSVMTLEPPRFVADDIRAQESELM